MCKILLVDDDDDVFDLAEAELSASGHEVWRAHNGMEALEFLNAIKGEPPCILVTDLRMPVMDGWDLVSALRRHSKWASLPVIVCSGLVDPAAAPPVLNARAYWSRRPSAEDLRQIHMHCARHHQSWPPLAMSESSDRQAG